MKIPCVISDRDNEPCIVYVDMESLDLSEHDADVREEMMNVIIPYICDINVDEIKSHDTDERLMQWIESWKAALFGKIKELG